MKKRTLSIVLTLLLILAFTPAGLAATEDGLSLTVTPFDNTADIPNVYRVTISDYPIRDGVPYLMIIDMGTVNQVIRMGEILGGYVSTVIPAADKVGSPNFTLIIGSTVYYHKVPFADLMAGSVDVSPITFSGDLDISVNEDPALRESWEGSYWYPKVQEFLEKYGIPGISITKIPISTTSPETTPVSPSVTFVPGTTIPEIYRSVVNDYTDGQIEIPLFADGFKIDVSNLITVKTETFVEYERGDIKSGNINYITPDSTLDISLPSGVEYYAEISAGIRNVDLWVRDNGEPLTGAFTLSFREEYDWLMDLVDRISAGKVSTSVQVDTSNLKPSDFLLKLGVSISTDNIYYYHEYYFALDDESSVSTLATSVEEPSPSPSISVPAVQITGNTSSLKTTTGLLSTIPPNPTTGQNLAYTVQKGETFGGIAFNYYGSMSNANVSKIKAANADYLKRTKGILEAGVAITLPANGLINPVTQSQLDKAVGMYLVKTGDTLGAIAKVYYGNFNSWTKIYEANKDRIKIVRNNPIIYKGQWLVIPE